MSKGQIIYLMLLIGGFLFSLVAIFSVTGLWKRTALGRKLLRPTKRSPLRDNLLRSPGQTLQDKLLDKTIDFAIDGCLVIFLMFVAVGFVPLLLRLQFLTVLVWLILGVFVFLVLYRLRREHKEIRDMRLGLDGELATAEELNQLMHHGYYVFHDFPGDQFNIDHIVIGPAGVFAVETKTRSKAVGTGKQGARVMFEGTQLKFPNYQESKSIQQAKDQSKWLSNFLKKSVGKAIPVKPVLSLPGWLVERQTGDTSIMVINPKEALQHITSNAKVLNEQTIKQIKYQVEQRCRTVEPYKP
jgi:Ca2+/Na+ antiporter